MVRRHRSKTVCAGRRRRHGGSFWGKIKSGFKKAHDWVKGKKLISKVADAAGFDGVAKASTALGYGRRRRRHSRRRGAGLWDKIKAGFNKANDWLKEKKIISKVAKGIGFNKVGSAAEALGYGCRKRRYRRRRVRRCCGAKMNYNGGGLGCVVGGGINQQSLLNAYLKTRVPNT